jgi:hypothetical protein
MKRPSLDRLAAKTLADERVVENPPTRAERAASIAVIRGALADRARAKARRRWVVPLGAVAACAAAATGLWMAHPHERATVAVSGAPSVAPTALGAPLTFATAHPEGTGGFVIRDDHRAPLEAEMKLAPNDDVATGEGPLLVGLATGTKLDLEPRSEVLLPDGGASQIVSLRKGAVISHVAKLKEGERFVVRTSDAEVEVRGTVFRVAQVGARPCGTVTQVDVTEGRVVVRENGAEHVLGAGDHWERACPSAVPVAAVLPVLSAPSPTPRTAVAVQPSLTGALAPVSSPAAPASPPASSDLAAQNALFSDAMASKRAGNTNAAVLALDLLIRQHPQSPLREAAEAERMRLLAASHSDRAPVVARDYLARYPHGFAADDAKAVLSP